MSASTSDDNYPPRIDLVRPVALWPGKGREARRWRVAWAWGWRAFVPVVLTGAVALWATAIVADASRSRDLGTWNAGGRRFALEASWGRVSLFASSVVTTPPPAGGASSRWVAGDGLFIRDERYTPLDLPAGASRRQVTYSVRPALLAGTAFLAVFILALLPPVWMVAWEWWRGIRSAASAVLRATGLVRAEQPVRPGFPVVRRKGGDLETRRAP